MVCRDIVENHLRPLLNEGKYDELVKKWGEIINKEKETRVIKRKDTIEVRQLKNKMKSFYFFLLFGIPFGIFLIDTYISA